MTKLYICLVFSYVSTSYLQCSDVNKGTRVFLNELRLWSVIFRKEVLWTFQIALWIVRRRCLNVNPAALMMSIANPTVIVHFQPVQELVQFECIEG